MDGSKSERTVRTIEIVSHCYAEKLPQYAGLLQYQLASLVLHRPAVDVLITVCCSSSDRNTMEVIDRYSRVPGLRLHRHCLAVESVGRRCIGRNQIAINTKADLVWFADVDHVFGEGCLDELATLATGIREFSDKMPSMLWVRQLWISRTHELGAQRINEARNTIDCMPDVCHADFEIKNYNRAIGGVQIVYGDFARRHGYLNADPKWQRARTDGVAFGDFRDDIAFRKYCGQQGELISVAVPNLYRIRHLHTTYQDKDHGKIAAIA